MGPPGIWSTASWTPISESPTGLQPYGSAHYPPPSGFKATGSGADLDGVRETRIKSRNCWPLPAR